MDKKTTAIIAVVIVVVVAIAVYSLMNDGDSVEKEDVKYVFEDNDSYLLKVWSNYKMSGVEGI